MWNCPSPYGQYLPTGQVVTFVYTDWIALYPQFSSVTMQTAQAYFNQACLYVDNTPASVITDIIERTTLLYLVTAHIAQLLTPAPGSNAPSGLVGRISSANEGSVSVSTDYKAATSDLGAWLNQTQYGAMYWAATLKYRVMLYIPPCPAGPPYGPRF